ncbi:hypothetical protein HYS96_03520 [Candidatus Daviesbacteria bacterium]|nr:hypothetical protein [Candidatus Daviesbacteria bacterium]
MSATNPEADGPNIPPDIIGDHPGDASLALFRNLHFLEGRPKIDVPAFMQSFRRAVHLRELDGDLVVIKDPVGLKRVLPDGTVETYEQKMAKERQKGRNEAVSYGIGTLGKNNFMGIIFNWEFMAGTSGVVAGEKFIRAKNLAIQANVPMIVVCASGGQRQQEGVAA